MAITTMSYDAGQNRPRPVDPPTNSPASFSYQGQATSLRLVTELAGGVYSYAYDNGRGQLKAAAAPSGLITSMIYSAGVGTVEPSNISTSLAWDKRPPTARAVHTSTTLNLSQDAAVESAPAEGRDPLDDALLISLDAMLADPDATLDDFWNLLTTEDDRCRSIWRTLCRQSARRFAVDFDAVLNEAHDAFRRSLASHGPHQWLLEKRDHFIPWFSVTAGNHVRNATRKELRCPGQIGQIGKLSRENRPLELLCLCAADPSFAIDFLNAVRDMPEELQAVFYCRVKSRIVGLDDSGREIRQKPSVPEIARELGISVRTATRLYKRAQEFLQRRFPNLRIGDED